MTERDSGWQYDPLLKRDRYLPTSELGPIGVKNVYEWAESNKSRMENHLKRYFGARQDVGRIYKGQLFEWFIQRSDPVVFTAYDILAVKALSIGMSPDRAQWLLTPHSTRDELLKKCAELISKSPDSGLWECDEKWIAADSDFSKLYDLLRNKSEGHLGMVTTSKLLAAKFPSFVPIRDSLVETLLGLERSKTWWEPIRKLLLSGSPPLHEVIVNLPMPDGAANVGVLRRLDVILWMEMRSRLP